MNYKNQYVLAKQLPGYLAYFVTGIFVFLNFEFIMLHKIKFFFLSVFLLAAYYFSVPQMNLFYPAAFGFIIIIAAYNLKWFNNFGKYGDFTYGLYIYHFPIIQLFRQYDLFEKYNPYLMTIVVILIAMIFAVLSWFIVEKRFLDRFKKNNKTQIATVC
jgi:peptidoglycan/LPS O-acetylase OafA/YrhL